jgi:dsRNA-specific ribonuclease
VIFENEPIGEGEGRSKKEAEQDAARDALGVIDRFRRARAEAQHPFSQ